MPQSALINDTQNLAVKIQPGKTYLVRMINIGAFAAQYVWFEGHTMRVVEVDGIYTEPMEAEMIYLTAAQRYSVLLTAKNDTSSNFAFVGSMDEVGFESSYICRSTYAKSRLGSLRRRTCRSQSQRDWLACLRRY